MRTQKGSKRGPARALEAGEIDRLARLLEGVDRALIWACLGGGLRASEAACIRIEDLLDGDARVAASYVVSAGESKSGRSRRVYWTDTARSYLQEACGERREGWLFPSRRQPHLTARSTVRRIKQLLEKARVPNATSHSLRRTYAVELRRQGADLAVIQQLLGHSSLSVTQVYLGVTEVDLSQAVAQLRGI